MELRGKAALITGGGRGLGAAVARRLTGEGVRVAVSARSAEEIRAVAEETDGVAVEADVSREEDCRRMVQTAIRELGQLDILVNNAGVGFYGPFLETEAEGWRAMISTNLLGTIYASHEALKHMVPRRGGHIVNISSVAGIHGIPNEEVYCASKHGVVGFSASLARNMKEHGIRVSCLCPGGINTPWWDASPYSGEREETMDPEAVAEVVVLSLKLPQNTLMKSAVFFPVQEWH